jgi:hypothetical protein
MCAEPCADNRFLLRLRAGAEGDTLRTDGDLETFVSSPGRTEGRRRRSLPAASGSGRRLGVAGVRGLVCPGTEIGQRTAW